ncbi:translationally-controlled tumor protein homolog [Nymphaea colorata]|uniref:translationally-controlled tumor protein homolog n=1 Tax=Nymphaea colorata TaxID=210225 RepID=UPI00214E38B1|nr:translationally-controlled tumor protein homolog [Nymphaea colorata]
MSITWWTYGTEFRHLPQPFSSVHKLLLFFEFGHIIAGDELLSDSSSHTEIANGMLWEVEGKWVVQGTIDVDIGANPSAEGADEDDVRSFGGPTKVLTIKQFVTYMKRHIKAFTPKLDEEKQELFKKHIEEATKFLLSKLKTFSCECLALSWMGAFDTDVVALN